MSAGRSVFEFSARAIGVIKTPFTRAEGTPIQPLYAEGVEGRVVLDDQYEAALADIEGFERLWLVYWFDRAGPFQPSVIPYRDTTPHGLFATRSPCRANPIGLSLVRLIGRSGKELSILDIDVLDDTPLLDIKPYVPEFDSHPGSRAGWFDLSCADVRVADDRFHR
jgi:tRNA-Thr(GGU) m(6)t(6)A37 methyltransferase TsaA